MKGKYKIFKKYENRGENIRLIINYKSSKKDINKTEYFIIKFFSKKNRR